MKSKIFDFIEINDNLYENWEQVVDYVGNIFTERGFATTEYFDHIKKDLVENEAYMVIIPHLVLLHSSPKNGSIRGAFHLMKLRNAVDFGSPQNDPVNIVITFTSTGDSGHIESIQKIAALLMDDKFMKNIMEADSKQEIVDFLDVFDDNEM